MSILYAGRISLGPPLQTVELGIYSVVELGTMM